MRSFLVLAATILATATAAAAEPQTISDPDWDTRPTIEMLARAYPVAPMRLRIQGRTSIRCDVSDLGVLENCELLSESPEGMGFGEAALGLAHRFRMKPRTVGGEPVAGGVVRIPISFSMPEAAPRPELTPAPAARLAAARQIWSAAELAEQIVSALHRDMAEFQPRGATAELAEEARSALMDATRQVAPSWAEAMLTHYASIYDEVELKALAEFARTPGGRAWLALSIVPPAPFDGIGTYLSAVSAEARRLFCASHICSVDWLAVAPQRAETSIVDPAWLQAPTFEQVMVVKPRLTTVLLLGGLVRLKCQANAYGVPKDCHVIGETPQELGFGAAALKLAPYYKLSPQLIGQGAAREPVSFVVVFPGANLPGMPEKLPLRPGPASAAADALATEVAERNLRAVNFGEMLLAPLIEAAAEDETPPKTRADALEAIRAAAQSQLQPLVARAASHYQERLTATELEHAARFLRSEMGQRITRRDPTETKQADAINRYHLDLIGTEAGRAVCKRRGCEPGLSGVGAAASPSAGPPTP